MAIQASHWYIAHRGGTTAIAGRMFVVKRGLRLKGDHAVLIQAPGLFVDEASGLTDEELDAANQRNASAAD